MYSVRTFQPTPAEYAAIVAIYNAAWPDERPITVQMARDNDQEWPTHAFHQRIVIDNDDMVVASGACYEAWWQHQPGTIHLDFTAHPLHAGRGVEELLYNALLARLQEAAIPLETLATNTREDRQEQVDFLVARGFVPAMRSPKSGLEVASFDPARFRAVFGRLAQQGISICTLAELSAQEANWRQKLRNLRWAILQDVPSVEPPTEPTMEDFARIVLDDPALEPEAWFIAVDMNAPDELGGKLWIGQSNLWINDPTYQQLDTGLTGTLRSYRRLGIATAMKVRTIEFAQRKGARRIATSNEENNPMYQINLMLGFQPRPAWVSYRKQVAAHA